MACYDKSPPTLNGCTFDGNVAGQNYGGGLRAALFSPPTVTSSTFYGNSVVGTGAGISTDGTSSSITLDKTIIAFNHIGEGLEIVGSLGTITCTDIYGNAGGDWGGLYLPAYLSGPYDNLNLDPLLCDPNTGDFELRQDSPCAPSNSPGQCGLIGAWPVGCCQSDLSGDDLVNLADLSILLGSFGACSGDAWYNPVADLTGDGCVNLADLSILLGEFGSICA
jgi:hypothetical protein